MPAVNSLPEAEDSRVGYTASAQSLPIGDFSLAW